jgi:hypothetical protein
MMVARPGGIDTAVLILVVDVLEAREVSPSVVVVVVVVVKLGIVRVPVSLNMDQADRVTVVAPGIVSVATAVVFTVVKMVCVSVTLTVALPGTEAVTVAKTIEGQSPSGLSDSFAKRTIGISARHNRHINQRAAPSLTRTRPTLILEASKQVV